MTFEFATTIKNGLPVIAEAEFDREFEVTYVTGLYWRKRNGSCGKPVPNKVYEAVTSNEAELRRLNRQAETEGCYQW